MITHENGVFQFTGEDAEYMRREFDHPDPDGVARRRAFLKEASESMQGAVYLPDGSVLVHLVHVEEEDAHGF